MAKTKTTVVIDGRLQLIAAVACVRDHRNMNSLINKALEVYCKQVKEEDEDEWDMAMDALADLEQVDLDKAKLERQLGED